jgi:aspartyl protease family protein
VTRLVLVLFLLTATASGVIAWRDPERMARATDAVSDMLRHRAEMPSRAVQVPRSQGGEFAVQAKINGIAAPMVVDTGATAVVLTWETAKAVGLPLEVLEYDVDLDTAGGHTKAARLTLDRLAIGHLVERAVPALVVPRGKMKTNLLGMSFLDRLESWEVRNEHLMLRGFAQPASHAKRGRSASLN